MMRSYYPRLPRARSGFPTFYVRLRGSDRRTGGPLAPVGRALPGARDQERARWAPRG